MGMFMLLYYTRILPELQADEDILFTQMEVRKRPKNGGKPGHWIAFSFGKGVAYSSHEILTIFFSIFYCNFDQSMLYY